MLAAPTCLIIQVSEVVFIWPCINWTSASNRNPLRSDPYINQTKLSGDFAAVTFGVMHSTRTNIAPFDSMVSANINILAIYGL